MLQEGDINDLQSNVEYTTKKQKRNDSCCLNMVACEMEKPECQMRASNQSNREVRSSIQSSLGATTRQFFL